MIVWQSKGLYKHPSRKEWGRIGLFTNGKGQSQYRILLSYTSKIMPREWARAIHEFEDLEEKSERQDGRASAPD